MKKNGIEGKVGYPAEAVHWHIDAGQGSYPSTVFRSIICAEGLRFLLEHEAGSTDVELRPDSIAGELLLWSEMQNWRFLVVRTHDSGALALVRQGYGTLGASIAAKDIVAAREALANIQKIFPRATAGTDPVLPFSFWHYGTQGSALASRKLDVVNWEEIAGNYQDDTRRALLPLMQDFAPSKNNAGQLMLWHGEAGTGKTYAIRALAWAWREWCRFEYVVDPEQLFDCGNYLMEVLLNSQEYEPMVRMLKRPDDGEEEPDNRWRLLIVEDSDELMRVDAKALVGQGLSRLLNVTDGLLGQGTKVLILITTNEDFGKLNPAVVRPGRCLSQIQFRRFDTGDSNRWLNEAGSAHRVNGSRTLSELYELLRGRERERPPTEIGFRPSPGN